MKTTVEFDICEFPVPDRVLTKSAPARDIYLSEIPAEDLDTMCERFAEKVFKKAGKHRPPQPERS